MNNKFKGLYDTERTSFISDKVEPINYYEPTIKTAKIQNHTYSINFDKTELYKEIENLQQELQRKDNEIKQLREDVKNHIKIASEYKEQMIIKDNNWNELKEWLNEPHITYNFDATEFGIEKIECVSIKDTLNKIKELENDIK